MPPDPDGLITRLLKRLEIPMDETDIVVSDTPLAGPGILGLLDPGGPLHLASLPFVGMQKARRMTEAGENIGTATGFLRRVIGDIPADEVSSFLHRSRSPSQMESNMMESAFIEDVLLPGTRGAERNTLRGVSNALADPQGFGATLIDLLKEYKRMDPDEVIHFTDNAAIQTLLEMVGGR